MKSLKSYWPIVISLFASLAVIYIYGNYFGWSISPIKKMKHPILPLVNLAIILVGC